MEDISQHKKLSSRIERFDHDPNGWTNNYIYKFRCAQYLESIDDMSSMTSFSYNECTQIVIDNLVYDFTSSLNKIIFGHLLGKEHIEYIETLKK